MQVRSGEFGEGDRLYRWMSDDCRSWLWELEVFGVASGDPFECILVHPGFLEKEDLVVPRLGEEVMGGTTGFP